VVNETQLYAKSDPIVVTFGRVIVVNEAQKLAKASTIVVTPGKLIVVNEPQELATKFPIVTRFFPAVIVKILSSKAKTLSPIAVTATPQSHKESQCLCRFRCKQ